MANRFANKYQWGKESPASHGTAVAADTLIVGPTIQKIDPDRVPIFHQDNIGMRGGGDRVTFGNYLWKHPLVIEHGYFQILPMIFSCALKGGVTPAEQTASQGDMLWDHSPALVGSNSLDSISLELGDDSQAYQAEYGMFERIILGAQIAQAAEHSSLRIAGDFFARQLTPVSFTGGISIPTVTPIDGKLSRIYIDSAWANLGNTEKTSLLRSWELEILNGAHPKHLGSAYKYFTEHGQGDIVFMVTLAYERGAVSDAEWDAFRLGTKQAMRIEIDSGIQIGTGVNHKLTLDMWGAYEYVTPINEEDRGNNIDAALFVSRLDPTANDLIDLNTITNVSAI